MYKKIGILTVSSAIALSSIMPAMSAAEVAVSKQTVSIEGSSAVSIKEEAKDLDGTSSNVFDVDQEKLIAKVRELFPTKFDFVRDQDFRMDYSPMRPDTDVETYRLSFSKEYGNGKYVNGNFEFSGENLTLVSFYYNPADRSDAIYPPKISKEEAETIATTFLENLQLNDQYQLLEKERFYNPSINTPLTEPIEYRFAFDKLKNGVRVQDQNVSITVLANGEVIQFFRGRYIEDAVYEQKQAILSKNEALQKVKDQLQVDLRYNIQRDYQNNSSTANLTYAPAPFIFGIQAKTGKFKIGDSFVNELPKQKEIKLLSNQSVQKDTQPLTKEQAKAMAEKLLKPIEDNVKLVIEGIQEAERNGSKIYRIQYMYYRGSSGTGSSFEINRETGEIINFYNSSRDIQMENDSTPALSKEEALDKAVQYIKEYAYSNMNDYSYPLDTINSRYQNYNNEYSFYFPRIKDGIVVEGDGIRVGISALDGGLDSLNVNKTPIDQWPDPSKAIDKTKALLAMKENLDLKLTYVNNGENVYDLVYTVKMDEEPSYLDAIKGQWQTLSNREGNSNQNKFITHPWAQAEINYLISANIIKIDDPETFNPDGFVTKGEALEIIYKSLARFYEPLYRLESVKQESTFENIQPSHPLYNIIERAAQQKIIDTSNKTFNIDEKLTREELAYWYARALGLQIVAERSEAYKMDFADVSQMNEQYKGHIALIQSLGILTKDASNEFNPKQDVSLAELAVSNIRLAKLAARMNIRFR